METHVLPGPLHWCSTHLCHQPMHMAPTHVTCISPLERYTLTLFYYHEGIGLGIVAPPLERSPGSLSENKIKAWFHFNVDVTYHKIDVQFTDIKYIWNCTTIILVQNIFCFVLFLGPTELCLGFTAGFLLRDHPRCCQHIRFSAGNWKRSVAYKLINCLMHCSYLFSLSQNISLRRIVGPVCCHSSSPQPYRSLVNWALHQILRLEHFIDSLHTHYIYSLLYFTFFNTMFNIRTYISM